MKIDEFLRTKPAGARTAYRPRLQSWANWLTEHSIDIRQANQGDFLEHVEGLASPTQAQTLSVIRMYLRWEGIDDHPLLDPKLKIRKTRPRKLSYVTPEDYWLMVAAQDTRTAKGVRNAGMLMVLFDTGARIAELKNIQLQDLDLDARRVTLLRKGGNWDPTRISKATVANLRLWLLERNRIVDGHDYLFCAIGGRKPGAPLTRDGAQYVVNDIAREAGITVTAHSFRRGLAIYLDAQGVPRAQIISHLGWQDGSMLDLYLRHNTDDEELRRALPGNMLEVGQQSARVKVEIE